MAMKFEQVHAVAAQAGTWVSYAGAGRTVLAIVLVAAALGAVWAGIRLPLPLVLPRPGKNARTIMLTAWVAAIVALLACVSIYVQQAVADHLQHGAKPVDHIAPVTGVCVIAIFVAILTVGRSRGWPVALASAAIGAMAAPMIFEFPFDLIVMARTYPPVAPDPALYRVLFFAPLFLVEFTTLALLALSPLVRVSRVTFFCFAVMLLIFAFWGLHGFGYPATAFPIAMNAVSKVVAFVAGLSLFLPQRVPASTAVPETPALVPTSSY
jgi:hypothetical protein